MSITTYPLDGIDYDAADAAGYFATRQSGVYSSDEDFVVRPAGGLRLTVSAGQAWVHPSRFVGYSLIQYDQQTLVLSVADSKRPRIDRIVLRCDLAARQSSLVVLQGTDSTNPTAPSLTRTNLVYDLCLAEIARSAGSTGVLASDITDTRLDEELCGVMRDGVTGIPTADLLAQAKARINALQETASASAQAAANSEKNAATSATAAASSATAAKNSQTAAKTSESNAASSATTATTKANAAASSQKAAADSEKNAAASQTAAKSSETAAASSASAAKTSETNAAASAKASQNSQTAAKTSETNAASSASAAAESASAAKTSETAAASSASGASSSASAAAKSASGAAASASAAKADAATASEMKQFVEQNVGSFYNSYTLTLAVSGWASHTGEPAGYGYHLDAALTDATTERLPVAAIAPASIDTAQTAQLATICQTADGSVRFFAKTKPAKDLTVYLTLFGKR